MWIFVSYAPGTQVAQLTIIQVLACIASKDATVPIGAHGPTHDIAEVVSSPLEARWGASTAGHTSNNWHDYSNV